MHRNEKADAERIPTENNISSHPPGWDDIKMLETLAVLQVFM